MIVAEQQYQNKQKACVQLRALSEQDAEQLIAYTMEIAQGSEFMMRYPEEVEQNIQIVQQKIARMRESKRNAYIGAFLDGVLVGNLGLYEVNDVLRTRHRCAIGLGVRASARNQGIASLLLREGITLAKNIGYEQMELDVVEDNKAAIHLYECYGFEPTGRIPKGFKMKDGRTYDLIFMIKQL